MPPRHPRTRRHLRIAAATLALLLTISGMGLRHALRSPSAAGSAAASREPTPAAATPTPADPTTAEPDATPPGDEARAALPLTHDPDVHATAVARALLTWDTTAGPGPLEGAQPVLLTGDPTGQETAGLLADVTAFLPTDAVWADLRMWATRQEVTVHQTSTPHTWQATADSEPGRLVAPGTTAVTVHATRHRSGVWMGEAVRSDHPVTFTVFLACPPPDGPCHTLRLSRPDHPLP